jgi:ketosteroid isomerase-like protein
MHGPAGSGASPSAREPLDLVRHLYDAWNTGNVAGAAQLLSSSVRWETFGGTGALSGREGLQTTLAGASSGGTWQMSTVSVDTLVRVVEHVIAFTRRGGPDGERERLEVWTVHDGAAVHYRGFPLEEGLAVLTETTGSRRLEAVCRGVLAFDRGDTEGWIELFDPDVEFVTAGREVWRGHAGMRAYTAQLGELWPTRRLDDVEILAESATALVISAIQHLEDPARGLRVAEPLHLVMGFDGRRARRVSGHPTAEEALAAASGR